MTLCVTIRLQVIENSNKLVEKVEILMHLH
jgi:hypothetical protein